MKIVHMIDDYKCLCREAEQVGQYAAYKAYTEKYPYFFSGVFRYLYRQPIEYWQEMIEQVDFRELLQVAEENYASGMVDYSISCVRKFMERMGADIDFTLLLGMELSNIGGCATPADWEVPCLYIGIDKPLEKEFIDLLIPHEMCHLMRAQMFQRMDTETVFGRLIEEGIASYASMWAYDLPWNLQNVARNLCVSETQVDHMMKATDTLLQKLASEGNQPVTYELMCEYFTTQDIDQEYPVKGYYLGLYLAHRSVENGVPFEKLISMSAEEIQTLWF